ncbi:MAG: beta-class carbonic anhydrase [Mycobacteriales bacterium]
MTENPFADVLAANRDYAARFDLGELPGQPARALAVLTCMDARLDPLAILGLRPGDAKIVRNPGGRVTPESLGALVIARGLLGVNRVMVVVHTRCRMAGAGEAELRSSLEQATGVSVADLTLYPVTDQVATLREDVAQLRACPQLAGVSVGGFRYDVTTGALEELW